MTNVQLVHESGRRQSAAGLARAIGFTGLGAGAVICYGRAALSTADLPRALEFAAMSSRSLPPPPARLESGHG
jgi:hypothetical protein